MSGMTLWKVRTHKAIGAEEWTNVYVVNASNLAAAVVLGEAIATTEKAVHCRNVTFGLAEVEPAILGGGGGTVFTIGGVGSLAYDADSGLLFVCSRVVFRPSAGKPSQKYLRGNVNAAQYDHATGTFITSFVATLTSAYLTPMLAMAAFVDVDGQAFVGGAVVPHVQERQLKRRRRARPGFRRGWVAIP